MKNGIIYALMTSVLFVTLEPVSKLIANEVNPYAITFWRFILGSLMLLPLAVAKIKKEKIHIGIKDFGIMSALGILIICISMLALQIGVKKADSPSLIAIIFSANSIFTILFATLILKEKLNWYKILALIFGAVGIIACTDFSSATNVESVLYALFSALSFSLYTVLCQKYTKKFGGIIQTSIGFLMGSLALLLVLLVSRINIMPSNLPKTLPVLLYVAFFVTGLGYAFYFKAIEKGGSIMASLTFFIKPILTPFITFFINDIIPDWKVFVAAACIVVASYFATKK